MRDLNSINSAARSTAFLFTVSLVIPLITGLGAWALATGAAPKQPLCENYLALFGLAIASVTIVAAPLPYIFRWNWEAKYFGATMLPLGSASIPGVYAILCIAQYSSLPRLMRIALLLIEGILITRWCLRFAKMYKAVYSEKRLFEIIYVEDSSAVYYSQQADRKIIEKILKFEQFPQSKYFILSGLAAFSLTPFATLVSQLIGIPFTHIFLAIFSTPVNLMFLGLSTKGWLIFYFYPMKIKKETNKLVYVDISSPAPKYLKNYILKNNH